MSNQNINISANNIAGKCDMKCAFNFKYSDSNSTAKNNGVMISLTYDSNTVPPVVFNNEKYVVDTISIVSPSIHVFDNNKMPGEVIITHNQVKGGNVLEVCIPIKSSSDTTSASQFITEIINKVSANAPSEGDSTNLNIPGFNLQYIVPRKPFFSYNQGSSDYIVYSALDAIPLNSTTLSTLQQIIKPLLLNTPGTELFFNSQGPVSDIKVSEGIYISCQPTGSTKEETAVKYDKTSPTTLTLKSILENSTVKLIIMILVSFLSLIVLFYVLKILFDFLSPESARVSFLNT